MHTFKTMSRTLLKLTHKQKLILGYTANFSCFRIYAWSFMEISAENACAHAKITDCFTS